MRPHHTRSAPPVAPSRRRGRTPARLTTAITTTALLAATMTAATIAAGTATAAPGCAPVTAILVPGTGETHAAANPAQPVGLLAPVGNGLAARYGTSIDVRYLPYPAAATPYANSESAGVQALSGLLSGLCSETRIVLAGYSQGADVAGDVASAIGTGTGTIAAARVAAVALIADPRRDAATPQLGTATAGQGVSGPRPQGFGALTDRVRTVCTAGDLYCATSQESSPAWTALGRAFTGEGGDSSPAVSTTLSSSGDLDAANIARQVVIVARGLAQFAAGVPTLLNDLATLPGAVISGNIPEAHRLSGSINTAFSPLVRLADEADLALVARALELAAPMDSSGTTAIAAQIVSILARTDLTRVATDIGIAQEIAWRATEKLAFGDVLGAGIELVGLIPVAADLAATAAQALTGTTGSGSSLASSLTDNPDTSAVLADLARQGSDAARFYTSGVHQTGYDTHLPVVLDWLTTQIDRTK
ncbi:cutinase family protein [Nocardia otitidiscaviarum]|uniref:cutinase family protein n=1 Tax=Nocardia otitidiscaviarum TaxID=1823 RepID=UPI0018947CF5|nr:cutinase family protein [Nocardia otitidiscaviarum]MBF6238709.1 cutinase family protein [Nocardia otitidiscaviarum]